MGTKSVHKLTPLSDKPLVIIGIASHENDYRISWALNTTLGYSFVKADNHQVLNKKFNEIQEFSTYISIDNENGRIFKLISNRCDNGFLFEDLRTLDYIIIINNIENTENIDAVVSGLKTIPFISTAFLLKPDSVKGLNRLK